MAHRPQCLRFRLVRLPASAIGLNLALQVSVQALTLQVALRWGLQRGLGCGVRIAAAVALAPGALLGGAQVVSLGAFPAVQLSLLAQIKRGGPLAFGTLFLVQLSPAAGGGHGLGAEPGLGLGLGLGQCRCGYQRGQQQTG